MNKVIDNYILSLKRNLTALPDDDLQDVVEFYQEFLLDGDFYSESAIVNELGTPKQLARKILADYSIANSTREDQEPEESSSKSNLKTIWFILLGVLAAPVGIPLVIATVFIMVAVLVVFAAIFIGFVMASAALFLAGLFIFAKSFGMLFSPYWTTGLFYLGASVILICIGLMLFPLIMKIIQFLIAECTRFFRYLGRKVFKKHYYQTNSGRKSEE